MRPIDADALEEEIRTKDIMGGLNYQAFIREAPTIEMQQPCEDVISRQAVLDRIRESIETYHNQYTTDMLNMWGLFTQFIKEMPPVTPQQKYGKWIDYSDEGFVECPFCGHATNCEDNINELHYCFHCGAKMQERSDKE